MDCIKEQHDIESGKGMQKGRNGIRKGSPNELEKKMWLNKGIWTEISKGAK